MSLKDLLVAAGPITRTSVCRAHDGGCLEIKLHEIKTTEGYVPVKVELTLPSGRYYAAVRKPEKDFKESLRSMLRTVREALNQEAESCISQAKVAEDSAKSWTAKADHLRALSGESEMLLTKVERHL